MTRPPTLLALCVSLALGTAQAAPLADPGAATPRVSCDLLDVRTAARATPADQAERRVDTRPALPGVTQKG